MNLGLRNLGRTSKAFKAKLLTENWNIKVYTRVKAKRFLLLFLSFSCVFIILRTTCFEKENAGSEGVFLAVPLEERERVEKRDAFLFFCKMFHFFGFHFSLSCFFLSFSLVSHSSLSLSSLSRLSLVSLSLPTYKKRQQEKTKLLCLDRHRLAQPRQQPLVHFPLKLVV